VRPLNREPGTTGGSRLSREAAASISQIIVTLTLLLASAGPTNSFLGYSCGNLRNTVAGYALAPGEGCWVKSPLHAVPESRDGRIVWMRDGVRFPAVYCKMTETTMQADCDHGGTAKPWRMIALEKLIPIGPRSCMEVSTSKKVILFNRTVTLTDGGTAMDTLEERVGHDRKGHCPGGGSPGATRRAYVRVTVRRIMVWEREATESLIKKTIAKGVNDILPNYIAGGMDTVEGTYVWNYTVRNCPEEELEELYNGRLGILDGEALMLSGTSGGQRAWLRLGKRVTICDKRMRQTHLPHVYEEWSDSGLEEELTNQYTVPMEERELESMRLEWSYLRGCDDYKLRRDMQDAMATGCWMKGTLMELRQLQAVGREGPGGVAHHFGLGHLALRSGGVAYVARCGMVVVELRNQTTCTQEIPVTYQGKEMYVNPFSLVLQHSATPVRCRRNTPPRWRIGKEWICGSCNGPGPLPGHGYGETQRGDGNHERRTRGRDGRGPTGGR
jgi:hypothetical protein